MLTSLGAEKVQVRVLAGSPSFVTHTNSDLDNRAGITAKLAT
jgi:hypothetical protein